MDRAKLFKIGQSQAVRLPKQLRFEGTEVFVRKLGSAVILLPVNDPWGTLQRALGGFSDDFLSERAEPEVQKREGLD
jgi:antitoxin VapB